MNPMKLYYMPGACSLATHIVLEWAQAAYEAVRLDRHAIKKPEYLALNPNGAVPLLVHGDVTLTESVAILGYLADLHPHLQLAGDGSARSRAEVMRWLAFLNSDVHGAFVPIFFPGRYLEDDAFALPITETARAHVREWLRRLDLQLKGRAWLTGSRSVADAYLFVMLRWAISTKVGLKAFANLSDFARRLHGDEGVHAALVMEEGLAPRGVGPNSAVDVLRQLDERLAGGSSTTLLAEVVGTVEYREGEGMPLEVRRGVVQVEITRMDTVLSWVDEKYRGEAAIPFGNFSHYVNDGAIRLAL
jgi:glutathione S-transferase